MLNKDKMIVQVKYFGRIAELTGKNQEAVDLVDANSTVLLQLLNKQYPTLDTEVFHLAVDQKLVNSEIGLNEQSEIALLPPFAGG